MSRRPPRLDFDTVYQQMTVAKQILDRFTITPIRNEDETVAETLGQDHAAY
jgi:mannitol operon transcriptional antiterminator